MVLKTFKKPLEKGMKHNPFILALDVEPEEAQKTIQELKPYFEIFKIGSRLFTALGPKVLDWVHEQDRKVFLDLKFHDIPLTTAESCRNAVRMKIWGFTIHTSGGFAMMRDTVQVTLEESKKLQIHKPLVFGVTVLTSLSESDLKEIGMAQPPMEQVQRLAILADRAGLDGVVASGNEVPVIREACGEKFLVMTPGIRFGQSSFNEDQKRVLTPKNAMALGSNYLVIGRPILQAQDRIKAAQDLLQEVGIK
jgi:orotidine-5'-phosphate decarboxylase